MCDRHVHDYTLPFDVKWKMDLNFTGWFLPFSPIPLPLPPLPSPPLPSPPLPAQSPSSTPRSQLSSRPSTVSSRTRVLRLVKAASASSPHWSLCCRAPLTTTSVPSCRASSTHSSEYRGRPGMGLRRPGMGLCGPGTGPCGPGTGPCGPGTGPRGPGMGPCRNRSCVTLCRFCGSWLYLWISIPFPRVQSAVDWGISLLKIVVLNHTK